MNEEQLIKIVASVIALAIAIIGHEIMHGYVAYRYGDNTAKEQGRLSINPIVHIDIVGTIILPALLFISGAPFLFGWAKPVPINPYTVLRNGGYYGMFNVSMAGIMFNVTLAVVSSLLFGVSDYVSINILLFQLVVYNVVLAMFNLLPIPPLDGSKAISYIGLMIGSGTLARFFDKIERYGMILLVLFLVSPLSGYFFAYVKQIILWLVL